jgi:hypothetical protein
LQDDYLAGMDELISEDDSAVVFLERLGLVWNDGEDCVDFYLGGPFEAPWLENKGIPASDNVDDSSKKLIAEVDYEQPLGLSW